MIQKFPRQPEFLGEVRCQRFHTKSFRCVMATVKDVQSQFFCQRKRPLRPLARDERVHAFISGNFQIAARAAGDNANFFTNIFAAGNDSWLRPDHAFQSFC